MHWCHIVVFNISKSGILNWILFPIDVLVSPFTWRKNHVHFIEISRSLSVFLDEGINNIFFKASVLGCLRSFSITNGKGPKNERNVLKYFFRLESLDTPPVVASLLLAIILLCLATVQSRGKQSCSLAVCWYICLEVWWVSNTLQLVSLGSICLVCS